MKQPPTYQIGGCFLTSELHRQRYEEHTTLPRIRTIKPEAPDRDECSGTVRPGAGCGRNDFPAEGDE